MAKRSLVPWESFGAFVGHLVVGAATFLLLCFASISLSLLVQALETKFDVPTFTVWILGGLADAILLIDAVLFLVLFVVEGVRAIREVWK
ncbi:hypothetical protein GCM10027321_20930 [Massilia terrae]|uniref:Uncharacterized protein n=1 Tax=Massilia terrae TaxID=1811224 RepID=A0ABT2CVA3_9BURK|nr:hypothetical protein [Massilia terrae]MCS0657900.1 hypothetical protein [Massilia terrae]